MFNPLSNVNQVLNAPRTLAKQLLSQIGKNLIQTPKYDVHMACDALKIFDRAANAFTQVMQAPFQSPFQFGLEDGSQIQGFPKNGLLDRLSITNAGQQLLANLTQRAPSFPQPTFPGMPGMPGTFPGSFPGTTSPDDFGSFFPRPTSPAPTGTSSSSGLSGRYAGVTNQIDNLSKQYDSLLGKLNKGNLSQAEMQKLTLQLQQVQQKMTMLNQFLTNMMRTEHERNMAVVRNLRA